VSGAVRGGIAKAAMANDEKTIMIIRMIMLMIMIVIMARTN